MKKSKWMNFLYRSIILIVLLFVMITINMSDFNGESEKKQILSFAVVVAGFLEAINTVNAVKQYQEQKKNELIHVGTKNISLLTNGIISANGTVGYFHNSNQRSGYHILQCPAPNSDQFIVSLIRNHYEEKKSISLPVNFELFFESSSKIVKFSISKIMFSVEGVIQNREFQSDCAIVEKYIDTNEIIKICFCLPIDSQLRRKIIDKTLKMEVHIIVWNSVGNESENILTNVLICSQDNITLISSKHETF